MGVDQIQSFLVVDVVCIKFGVSRILKTIKETGENQAIETDGANSQYVLPTYQATT
jgi:hypothetical protein